MKKQLVGLLLLSIILPISIAGCQSSISKQPQTIATAANIDRVNSGKNYQSSFIQRMQQREQDRQRAIAKIQSGATSDREIVVIAPEEQTPKSDKIDRAARAHRGIN